MGSLNRRLLRAAVWLGLPVAGLVYFLVNQDSDETAGDGPANVLSTGSGGGLYAATLTDDGTFRGVIDAEAQWGSHR